MKTIKSTVTIKGQTTVPKSVRVYLGVEPGEPIYWEIRDGAVQVTADEPAFLRWIGTIEVGSGSAVDDVRDARRRRGL